MIQKDAIIVGAGPSGLAISALLRKSGLDFEVLEKSNQIANSWKNHYDRLHLHTVKDFSNLPLLPFPPDYPRYVSRKQVCDYLDSYAEKFNIKPILNSEVVSISKEEKEWRIMTNNSEYLSKYVIVCTGYNHHPIIPDWKGKEIFSNPWIHSKDYRNPDKFLNKKVLVVGAGNTGAEIALDLSLKNIQVSMVVRGPLRIVPREILGIPTQINAMLLNLLPLGPADMISRVLLHLTTQDLSSFGIRRPEIGSVRQVKEQEKIPLIDLGTVRAIREGKIKIRPGIREFKKTSIVFENGTEEEFDSVIFATGYKSGIDGLFKKPHKYFNDKGIPAIKGSESDRGLYFLGFHNHITGFLRYINIESGKILSDIMKQEKNNV